MSLALVAGRPSRLASRFSSEVLVVDDDAGSRNALADALCAFGHRVSTAADASEGIGRLRADTALLVLDAAMPGVDGFMLARQLRGHGDWCDLPILMVTGHSSHRDRMRALESGIDDFLEKPWDLVELFLRSESLLRVSTTLETVKRERAGLEREVARRTAVLRATMSDLHRAHGLTRKAHLEAIRALVLAAEYKDSATAAHVDRMRWYCDLIARGLGLCQRQIDVIREAASMHDVGKIGIPDAILTKCGPLTPGERGVMKSHTIIGARILAASDAEIMRVGREIALSHHERWDGLGYPHGQAGNAIPLPARICAVADVFDALTVDRCYRKALPVGEVVESMRADRGHFDPEILQVLTDHLPEAVAIRRRLGATTAGVTPTEHREAWPESC